MKLLKEMVSSTCCALRSLPDISHRGRAEDFPVIPVTYLSAPSKCARYLIQLQ